MPVQSVAVIANLEKEDAGLYADAILAGLQERGLKGWDFRYRGTPLFAQIPDVDLAIVLGGDGTVLFACGLVQGRSVPILGINLGTLGFITEVVREEWKTALDKYLQGELGVSRRLMLSGKVLRQEQTIFTFQSLNDCVVSGSLSSRMVALEVKLTGILLGEYRADGLIVATPTGSTAYSLSAGGPILHPETDAFILTPICPHSLAHRSIVLPDDEKISITVKPNQRIPVTLTVDGREAFPLQEGDHLEIERLPSDALLVKSDRRSFYEVIRTKLN
jgi:NAD+ kinase